MAYRCSIFMALLIYSLPLLFGLATAAPQFPSDIAVTNSSLETQPSSQCFTSPSGGVVLSLDECELALDSFDNQFSNKDPDAIYTFYRTRLPGSQNKKLPLNKYVADCQINVDFAPGISRILPFAIKYRNFNGPLQRLFDDCVFGKVSQGRSITGGEVFINKETGPLRVWIDSTRLQPDESDEEGVDHTMSGSNATVETS